MGDTDQTIATNCVAKHAGFPLDADEVLRFKEGPAGYQRCLAVANALKADDIITLPLDDFAAAQCVAMLLLGAIGA